MDGLHILQHTCIIKLINQPCTLWASLHFFFRDMSQMFCSSELSDKFIVLTPDQNAYFVPVKYRDSFIPACSFADSYCNVLPCIRTDVELSHDFVLSHRSGLGTYNVLSACFMCFQRERPMRHLLPRLHTQLGPLCELMFA
jgi:hypothetical protein